jgi:hypothetical protein
MRLIHQVAFSSQEIESYRQLVFDNLTRGMKAVLDAMDDMELKVTEPNLQYIDLIENADDLRDGEPFPTKFYEPLTSLWKDPNVQSAYARGNEAALPEKLVHFSKLPWFLVLMYFRFTVLFISSPIWTDFSSQVTGLSSRTLFIAGHGQ